jgi:hypothetical protein
VDEYWHLMTDSPGARRHAREAAQRELRRGRDKAVAVARKAKRQLGQKLAAIAAAPEGEDPLARRARLSGPGRPGRLRTLSALSAYVIRFSMALLYERAGCLTAKTGDFRPGQWCALTPRRSRGCWTTCRSCSGWRSRGRACH